MGTSVSEGIDSGVGIETSASKGMDSRVGVDGSMRSLMILVPETGAEGSIS